MQFFTATINSWKPLLQIDEFKDIIVNSLQWLHDNNKVRIHGFVIMPNHIHLLWTILENTPHHPSAKLLSFTAHEFKKKLKHENESLLHEFKSTQADREYHFWERNSRTVHVASPDIAIQKLNYIHNNPLKGKWNMVDKPEDYHYSSASLYYNDNQRFSFLTKLHEYV